MILYHGTTINIEKIDRVGLQIRKYMEKEIDLPTFIERLQYMKGITIQYYFGTERAISLLRKV